MYMQVHYVVVLLNNIRTSGFLMKSPYCKKKKRSYQNPQKSRDEGWTLARALADYAGFALTFGKKSEKSCFGTKKTHLK